MDILVPEIAVAEKILRPVVVYGCLLVAFRMGGKRALLRKEGIATMSEGPTLFSKRAVTCA